MKPAYGPARRAVRRAGTGDRQMTIQRQAITRAIRTDFTESRDKNAACRYLLRHLGQLSGRSRRGLMESTSERLLTPGEVAALFRVDPKTVTRWAASGRIGSIRTPGGHRRFRESEVRALLRGNSDIDSIGSLALEAWEG